MRRRMIPSLLAVVVCAFWGCGQEGEQTPVEEPAEPQTEARRPADPDESGQPATVTTEEELKAALKEKNPRFAGEVGVGVDGRGIFAVEIHDPAIEDISPLAGLPLRGLDLARCRVSDIRVLEGMPLTELYLEENAVR
ncbi:MAG: hypothetical protein ACYSWU_13895, partial [Planctomycetota bacterium]